MRNLVIGAALAIAASGAANAQTDDFNRPDAATLGDSWTPQVGGLSILSNMAIKTDQAFGTALATLNGSGGTSISFDLFAGSAATQFGAVVFGWNGSPDNYFIKVQANSGGSAFDTFGFYRGVNDSTDGLFGTLSTSFTQASVTASYVGTLATLTINPLGGPQQVYNFDYGTGPTGTTNGLAIFGTSRVDNYATGLAPGQGGVPEPATWALLILGFAGIGAALRMQMRHQTVTVGYA